MGGGGGGWGKRWSQGGLFHLSYLTWTVHVLDSAVVDVQQGSCTAGTLFWRDRISERACVGAPRGTQVLGCCHLDQGDSFGAGCFTDPVAAVRASGSRFVVGACTKAGVRVHRRVATVLSIRNSMGGVTPVML